MFPFTLASLTDLMKLEFGSRISVARYDTESREQSVRQLAEFLEFYSGGPAPARLPSPHGACVHPQDFGQLDL